MSRHARSAALRRTTATVPSRRLAGARGLRGLAVLAVVLGDSIVLLTSHGGRSGVVQPLVLLGVCGMALFFVLSGFLLFRPYVAAMVRGRELPRTRDFYRNRVLRIVPALAAVALACVVLLAPSVTPDWFGGVDDPAARVRTGLWASWSLVPLLGFYLALPLLVGVARGATRRLGGLRASMLVVVLLLGIGLAGRFGVLFFNPDGVADVRRMREHTDAWPALLAGALLANLDLFALGMAVAVVVVAARSWVYSDEGIRQLRRTGIAMMLLSPTGFVAFLDPVVAGALFGCGCAGLLAWLMLPGRHHLRRRTVRLLDSAFLDGLGRISYGAYLWHLPLLAFLLLHFEWMTTHNLLALLPRLALVLAGTLLLAGLSHRFIEAPAVRLGRGGARPALPRRRTRSPSSVDWTGPLTAGPAVPRAGSGDVPGAGSVEGVHGGMAASATDQGPVHRHGEDERDRQ